MPAAKNPHPSVSIRIQMKFPYFLCRLLVLSQQEAINTSEMVSHLMRFIPMESTLPDSIVSFLLFISDNLVFGVWSGHYYLCCVNVLCGPMYIYRSDIVLYLLAYCPLLKYAFYCGFLCLNELHKIFTDA